MKKLFIITVLMALAVNGFAQILHYDFSAVCETGQTLYYLITNEEEHTVKITYPYSEENEQFEGDFYDHHPEPQGEIVLPSVVYYNGIQYYVTAIDANAFNNCRNLTGVLAIPESVVSIGATAFHSCGFTSLILSRNVEVIITLDYGYGSPFAYCSSLESIMVDDENLTFYSENNALIKREGKILVQGCKNTIIPDDVEAIGRSAFQGVGDGGNLVIPNSVISIDSYAFYECEFSGTLTLSDSLRFIGGWAFCYSHFTGSLTLPDSVTEIGGGAFAHCGLSGELILPPSLSIIQSRAFSSGGFSGPLIIPNSVTYIGDNAFQTANFSNLILGNSVQIIGAHAFDSFFSNIHITGVLRFPSSLTEIGNAAFYSNSFDAIYSPNTTPPTMGQNVINYSHTPIYIPIGCTEIYQNTEGWDYFDNFIESEMNLGGEWYYEIQNDDGSITYQHLEYASDTTIGNQRPKVIVRSNTHYDRNEIIEITHEYVYEENGIVYWWNKDLEEFTTLYNLNAETGDEWTIKVGNNSLVMHVDAVENVEYEGQIFRLLHVSDPDDLFSGDIVCGIGHLTSFFPERLMNQGKGYHMNGLRCYWTDGNLVFKNGDADCDAIYEELHSDTLVIVIPNHYGYLCQPDSANIELDPNSYLGYEYGDDFYAKFAYHPNGLLNTQYTYSISSDAFNTYIATYHYFLFYYDSEYHVIQQNDDYLIGGDEPFINHYNYDNGLLMTFTRHFDNYHENIMVLYDSISYAYDEQRQLQVEQRFNSLPLPEHAATVKNHEYLENKIIINTTDYFSGEWLSRETRTFNEDSLLVSSQTEKHNDSTVLVTYGYDEQGHQTSILTQKRNNGVWENQKLVQYLFNPYGRLTLAEIQLWQDDAFVDAHRAVYELNEMGYPATVTFEKWDGEAWVDGVWQSDFYLYDENHLKQQNDMFYEARNCIHKIELNYLVTENPREPFLPDGAEWYYEIINDNGSITYQYLQCAGDTTINDKRPKVIVRSNTQYDKDLHTEVTHEYVYEENGVVYWWNKELEEFTTLYDLTAKAGDEWEIRVGTESITVHVDSIGDYNFGGKTFRALYVSDSYGYYNGNILCGIGHLGSFFPERLMNQGKNYRVEGMRCYWVDGILVFKNGDEDCDTVYQQYHNSIDESETIGIAVYPNPANNILFVETCHGASIPDPTYRISNLMGQTVGKGRITAETQKIDIANLPFGMYFITINGATQKFVINR